MEKNKRGIIYEVVNKKQPTRLNINASKSRNNISQRIMVTDKSTEVKSTKDI